jgi:hypothetical protein
VHVSLHGQDTVLIFSSCAQLSCVLPYPRRGGRSTDREQLSQSISVLKNLPGAALMQLVHEYAKKATVVFKEGTVYAVKDVFFQEVSIGSVDCKNDTECSVFNLEGLVLLNFLCLSRSGGCSTIPRNQQRTLILEWRAVLKYIQQIRGQR